MGMSLSELKRTLSPAALQSLNIPTKKQGRYKVSHASARTCDGIVFDSAWECQLYGVLKSLVGVEGFTMQVPFELIPAYVSPSGKKVRATHYVADFVVRETGDVIDAKGHETEVFRLKRKMFERVHGKTLYTLKDKGNALKNTLQTRELLTAVGIKNWK
jgi:ribulose 1,5-bisphosphate synthetase/thiazole synthase